MTMQPQSSSSPPPPPPSSPPVAPPGCFLTSTITPSIIMERCSWWTTRHSNNSQSLPSTQSSQQTPTPTSQFSPFSQGATSPQPGYTHQQQPATTLPQSSFSSSSPASASLSRSSFLPLRNSTIGQSPSPVLVTARERRKDEESNRRRDRFGRLISCAADDGDDDVEETERDSFYSNKKKKEPRRSDDDFDVDDSTWSSSQRRSAARNKGRGQHASDEEKEEDEEERKKSKPEVFMSAAEKLVTHTYLDQHTIRCQAIEAVKKGNKENNRSNNSNYLNTGTRPSGLVSQKRRFNAPRPLNAKADGNLPSFVRSALNGPDETQETDPVIAEKLKAFDPKLVEIIRRDIVDSSAVSWDDIAGLEFAKTSVKEIVVWPMKNPDIFKGLRTPPKGMLLFGPPGTGKTMIGKAIASEAGAKFFSISASSLTSKWDEVDALLSSRTDSEFEASRRMKTELLVQMDGAASNQSDRVLVLGATNRPQDLDEAARRRLVKRLYIPLPNLAARNQLINHLLLSVAHSLSTEDVQQVAKLTRGYSGADLFSLCREAAMGPIRALSAQTQMGELDVSLVSPVSLTDFTTALRQVKPSVPAKDLQQYLEWNKSYGSWHEEEFEADLAD